MQLPLNTKQCAALQVDDLHRHFIDHLTIPSRQGKGVLRRDDGVFDCWFESGSMPYAQNHYPFENKEAFQVRSCFEMHVWLSIGAK